jgi:hypothetical protein
MVIIVSKEGQLANRIWHASSFLVNAKEHNYRLRHFFFDEYYSLFSESLNRNNTPIRFLGKRKTWLVSFLQRFTTILVKGLLKLKITRLPFFEIIKYDGYEQDSKAFDLNDEKYFKKAKSKITLISGWHFRDPVNQKKYRDLLVDTWAPNKKYRDNIEGYFSRYKKDHDVLVGVHIRGGDYKKFEGGKWYYTPEQYYEKIKEIAALKIFSSKKIAFIICTNEKNLSMPSTEFFSVFYDERHFVDDLYLLAKCDYIIGPPSTFSIWASFYGNVPLCMITDAGIEITDDFFKTNSTIY